MAHDSIRIAVVDDHPLMRDGVENALRQQPDMEVVGSGACADDAIRVAQEQLPDIMLLDMNMPGGGLAAIKQITHLCPSVHVIILTVREDYDAVSKAFALGARGYVLKGVETDCMLDIIRSVHAGDTVLTSSIAIKLFEDPSENTSTKKLANLTERETKILEGIGRGLSNKDIGIALDLSEKTIKHYVTNIFQMLQVRNRLEAALLLRDSNTSDT